MFALDTGWIGGWSIGVVVVYKVVYRVEGRMSREQNARADGGEAPNFGDAYDGRTEFGREGVDMWCFVTEREKKIMIYLTITLLFNINIQVKQKLVDTLHLYYVSIFW